MFKKPLLLIGVLLSFIFVLSACGASSQTSAVSSAHPPLTVYGDVVSGVNGCVLQSRYAPGDRVVFRMYAEDPTTQTRDDNASLQVHLSTGDVINMKFGSHSKTGKGEPEFWTAAYDVTKDTPTGTLTYYVTAVDGKKYGEFKPFNVKPSLITIVSANDSSSGSN